MGLEQVGAYECPLHCRADEKTDRNTDRYRVISNCGKPTKVVAAVRIGGMGMYTWTLCEEHEHEFDSWWGFQGTRPCQWPGQIRCYCFD